MKVLILGGTVFLGRALVDAARLRGHTVTLFNRGQHNPDLYPEIERLRGDRDGDLAALAGRRFDAVVDTCGYVPRIVRASAAMLAGQVDRYAFVSTLSVLADVSQRGADERARVATLADPTTEEINGETYGPLKALCERAVEEALPGRALVIRPGLIVGPHDPSDRFTYWPHRFAQGGEVLVPGRPERIVQFIDVRDLAEWTIRMTEEGETGIFNATGPEAPLPMRALVDACEKAGGAGAEVVWVDDAFLVEHEVQEWTELPLWLPESDAEHAGFFHVDNTKAIRHGLGFRPVLDTVNDTLLWSQKRPDGTSRRAGMRAEREAELLAAWRAERAQR